MLRVDERANFKRSQREDNSFLLITNIFLFFAHDYVRLVSRDLLKCNDGARAH